MTCFASTEVMLYKLPSEIGNENSFTEVKNYSLRTLFTAFKQSIDADVVYQSLTIDIKANTYKRPDETN